MMPDEKGRNINVAHELYGCVQYSNRSYSGWNELALNYPNYQAKSYGESLATKIKVDCNSIVLRIGVFELYSLNGRTVCSPPTHTNLPRLS